MKCYICSKNKNNIVLYYSLKCQIYLTYINLHNCSKIYEPLKPICYDCVDKFSLCVSYYYEENKYITCHNYPIIKKIPLYF